MGRNYSTEDEEASFIKHEDPGDDCPSWSQRQDSPEPELVSLHSEDMDYLTALVMDLSQDSSTGPPHCLHSLQVQGGDRWQPRSVESGYHSPESPGLQFEYDHIFD